MRRVVQPSRLRRRLDEVDHRRVELDRLEPGQRSGGDGRRPRRRRARSSSAASRRSATCSVASSVLRRSTVIVDRRRHDVHEVRGAPRCRPTVADLIAAELAGQLAHERHDLGRHHARVVAQPHRRGAGVRRLAADASPRSTRCPARPRRRRSATPSSSRIGPCSMCSSTYACGNAAGRARHRAGVPDPLQLVAEHGRRRRRRRMSSASSSGSPPTYTRLPSMSGAKRAPSSSVKNATVTPRSVRDAVADQRLDDLEPAEHAEVAVEAAAGARRCRCANRSSPAPATGRSRAGWRTRCRSRRSTTSRPRSRIHVDDEVAAVAVGVGQGEAGAARARRSGRSTAPISPSASIRAEQPVDVDPQVGSDRAAPMSATELERRHLGERLGRTR